MYKRYFINKIKDKINNKQNKINYKNNDNDFIRNRKMSFQNVVLYNLNKKGLTSKMEIEELNRLVIEELIEDIVIEKDNNVKIIFKCEDKHFEALDFINRQKCDIMTSSLSIFFKIK